MIQWFLNVQKRFIQRLGAVEEKEKAIAMKTEAAAGVMRKMGLMRVGGDRRGEIIPWFHPERRISYTKRVN